MTETLVGTHRHIAVIPGRASSKGLPGKNRYLFGLTVDFIRAADFFDRVIVTSDDEVLLEMARSEGFETRRRPPELASEEASIKPTIEDIVAHASVEKTDYLWLIWIPLVYKDVDDFLMAKRILDDDGPPSLYSFIPAKSHPYYCYRVDEKSGRMKRFIDNDVYRRQDLPDAWKGCPYLCAIRADAVEGVKSNLFRDDAYPILLDQRQADQIVDVDEEKDFDTWEKTHPHQFLSWHAHLPDDIKLSRLNRKKD